VAKATLVAEPGVIPIRNYRSNWKKRQPPAAVGMKLYQSFIPLF